MIHFLQSRLTCLCGALLYGSLAVACTAGENEPFVIEDVRRGETPQTSTDSAASSRLGFEHRAPSLEEIAQAETPAPAGAGLRWNKPEGWQLGPGKAMRLVTFYPAGGEGAEIYLTALPGHGGGMGANLNRWRGQMKQTPLSPDDIAALPRHEVLGQQAPLLEMEGSFQGMSGGKIEGARFLGLVVELGQQTLFVKMTGPSAAVARERENFLEFARSLSFQGSGQSSSQGTGS